MKKSSKPKIEEVVDEQDNTVQFEHPSVVYSCVVCNYADNKTHSFCPSCGRFNSYKLAPEWLAHVFRTRPHMFKRRPKSRVQVDENGNPIGQVDGVMVGNDQPVLFKQGETFGEVGGGEEEIEEEGEEEEEEEAPRRRPMGKITVQKLGDVKAIKIVRLSTGEKGFDHVTNGGLPINHCYQLAGSPGVGKSTKLREMACAVASSKKKNGRYYKVMYVAVEEAADVLRTEFKRQGLHKKYPYGFENVVMAQADDPDAIVEQAHELGIDLLIVDSISMVTSRQIDGAAGGAKQLVYAATLFMDAAHGTNQCAGMRKMTVVCVNHMTKDGDMAGSNKAKHICDGAFSMDHIDPISLKPVDDQNEGTGYVRLKIHGKYRRGAGITKAYYKMTDKGVVRWTPKNTPKLAVKKKFVPKLR